MPLSVVLDSVSTREHVHPLVPYTPVQDVKLRPAFSCQTAVVGNQPVYLCTTQASPFDPYLTAAPGVVIALIGFIVVHQLSVRRQRRDEQFKMVQATRDLVVTVADEAITAWAVKTGRTTAAPILIQKVGRIGRAAQMLKLRDDRFDVGTEITTFRQAVTTDFEGGSTSAARRAEIAVAAGDLDEAIYKAFIGIYG